MNTLAIAVLVGFVIIGAFACGVHFWVERAGLGDREFADPRIRRIAWTVEKASAVCFLLFMIGVLLEGPRTLLLGLLFGTWAGLAADAYIEWLRARKGVPPDEPAHAPS